MAQGPRRTAQGKYQKDKILSLTPCALRPEPQAFSLGPSAVSRPPSAVSHFVYLPSALSLRP